jgi:two-component system sensor histidine kinase KdpD
MRNKWLSYFMTAVSLPFAVSIMLPFRDKMNSTPVALVLLLIVLFTAAAHGSIPAVAMSIACVLCFNFFFLPPYYTLTVANPQNWIALFAFLATSLIAGSLSARVKRRAEESEKRQKEIERLYQEQQILFKKANEAAILKQSEQLKSALLDAVTHDLRTPLTSMKAAVTTLLAGSRSNSTYNLDEEGNREMLEVINTEIDRLNHHLEGLIEIAKLEAGAMQPRRTWSNLEEIVSISVTRAAGVTSHHRIHTDLEKNLPPVRVDEKAITEVLYLLMENAAKYAPANSIISVNVNKFEDVIKVSVEDQGPGIPPELREKVFDKFFRFGPVDPTSRPAPAGLGMGLAIARGIVEAHGGRIWIEGTASGSGTRVSFTIPVGTGEGR